MNQSLQLLVNYPNQTFQLSRFRLVNETRVIVLMQAGMQANQFASTIDCAGKITNFTESRAGKSFFFSQDSKETCC